MSRNDHELNNLLLSYLEFLDEYQALQNSLSKHLGSAFLSLSHARFVSHKQFGSDYYDHRTKAISRVSLLHDEWNLRDHKPARTTDIASKVTGDVTIRNRKEKPIAISQKPEGDNEKNLSLVHDRAPDPIKWFGILVPPSLRESQCEFRKALDDMIQLVNIMRKLDSMEQHIRAFGYPGKPV